MKTTANLLIQRAIIIFSDEKFLDEELETIKSNLYEVNGYPRKFEQNIIKYNLHKRNSIAPNLNEGNNSKETFINLKYAGQKGVQLISKMKKIVSNVLEYDIKLNVFYNFAKLSQYFNTKDPAPQKCKSYLNVHVLKLIEMNSA